MAAGTPGVAAIRWDIPMVVLMSNDRRSSVVKFYFGARIAVALHGHGPAKCISRKVLALGADLRKRAQGWNQYLGFQSEEAGQGSHRRDAELANSCAGGVGQ